MKLIKLLANKKFLLLLIILDLVIFLFWKFHFLSKNNYPYMVIKNQKIYLEIADTPDKITQGLSDRESLAPNQGMLFVFTNPGIRPFWMNRMKFNLDFIFFNNNQVVDLAYDIPFPKNNQSPQTVISQKPFNRVLEVNTGTINRLGVKIGDQASWLIK